MTDPLPSQLINSPVMFDNLSIFPATTLQTLEAIKRTYDTWGKSSGHPIEAYLERGKDMANTYEMAADARWTTWVLAPRDDPETLDFMCSCESLRREIAVYQRTSAGIFRPESEQKIGYGIASVYTPLSKRGKGYAKHMMRLLHWVLTPQPALAPEFPTEWGQAPQVPLRFGNGVLSVLYSDIGPQFYKACGPVPNAEGWTVVQHFLTTWDVEALNTDSDHYEEAEWTFLSKENLKRDSEAIMKSPPMHISPAVQTAFSFFPRRGLGEYLHRRIEWTIERLNPSPPFYGLQQMSSNPNAFASWTFEFFPNEPKTLLITRLSCPKGFLPGLMKKIAAYAKEFGIERIQSWNLPEDLKTEGQDVGGTSAPAEEHLASVKWYGSSDLSPIVWLHNEKFAWC